MPHSPHGFDPDTTVAQGDETALDVIATEQRYVDALFDHLDEDIRAARERLAAVSLRPEGVDPDTDDLIRREAEYHSLNDKLDRAALAQLGLVFGRIDIDDADPDDPIELDGERLDRRYIGRMGVQDADDHYRSLLLDWRAPMARPFYLATTVNPAGVHRRRHLRTRGRTVTAVDEERLLASPTASEAGDARADIAGESALVHALNAARTGHMSTIVETIQREQDGIIRDNNRGVMVVDGGPGTGKTAVALHRVAYLLYTWREQLAKTGVLIVGPNRRFLDYISRVLPELGETGVVLSTVGDLYPLVTPTGQDSLLAQEIKGSKEMVYILREAVKAYQQVPTENIPLSVDGVSLRISPAMVKKARTRARRSRKPHNRAQPIFADSLLQLIAEHMAEVIGADPLGKENLLSAADIAQLHDDLSEEAEVNEIIESLWPKLSPQQVLAELTCDHERLSEVAGDYDEATIEGLYRPGYDVADIEEAIIAWTPADAALLDELSVIIGIDSPEESAEQAERKWRQQIDDAQDALDILIGSANSDLDDESDAEVLSAHDVVDAETLAQRQQVRDNRSTAEKARADHTWAYGHVVVDEAQELSEMDWRMVFRRVPSRWMTIVGDTAQTGSPAGADSWAETFAEFVGSRVRHHELSVNYRTPASIMEQAHALLPLIAPEQHPSQSVRDVDNAVSHHPRETDVREIVAALTQQHPDRLVAVVAAPEVLAARADLQELEQARSVEEVKGLEFDHVVVVEPEAIAAATTRGLNDLYVALSRATQTVTIVGSTIEEIAASYA
ncbi:Helicase IV [Corynebacterium ciconiae DSM 44920]|uniref:HelD family protein n=1 Tax=Corynebacterium ciconiae TaxID=227319 RepID=UPI00036A23CB|nr:ATP-binding domain-containing protein [Corynebacterium ciconiae]WKD61089.1 Helicase IV [Corynebacterium ciconiae DSM 44920]